MSIPSISSLAQARTISFSYSLMLLKCQNYGESLRLHPISLFAELTFPSGSSAKSPTSDSSTLPNLPMSPCSFKPVKVRAMRQKRMWPAPEVVKRIGSSGEKHTL